MAPLSIYKASAGSGKTFRLTMGYMELLFRDPMAYKHILAVTFTNKAASEMKSRILERLFQLSVLGDEENSGDLYLLMESTGFDRHKIVVTARELLVRILNDYSRFSVGTIDRFFQGVIRAFTREIGLSAGFNLELDRDRILSEAIDRMFLDLGNDAELLDWMLRLAESRIEDSKGWNFRQDIENLGQELFSEAYQAIMLQKDAQIDRKQLNKFKKELSGQRDATVRKIREIASSAQESMQSSGYTLDDFYRKSTGVASFFNKVINEDKLYLTPTQKLAISDMSRWISTKEQDSRKTAFIEAELMPRLGSSRALIQVLNSINEVDRNIFTLGILGDLSARIYDITDEKNLFLLSDASRFLKGLIGNNPTPFIYEKTGNFIEHIMLDEFQDTSVFQWENFRPLIEHSLSIGKESIIVGDVKQSIYRWRNSDWKILAEKVVKSFRGHEITEVPLDKNWRSCELIIRFNNTLFSSASSLVKELVTNAVEDLMVSEEFRIRWKNLLELAYDQVEQKIPDDSIGSGGFVKGEILESDDISFRDLALDKIPGWIRELEDAGYRAGEIAILVRKNKEGAEVAKVLMEIMQENPDPGYNFNFVSNESLYLDSNTAIKFLISVLHFIHNDRDELNVLTMLYFHKLMKEGGQSDPSEALNPGLEIINELGEEFIHRLPELKRLPLFELVETLADMFSIDKRPTDLPYLQAFQEIVLKMQQSDPGSLHDFLTYWAEFGSKKTISVSDNQDAIRIITIHKAKGLQYKAVIIPFCDWELSPGGSGSKDTILWCNTGGTIFETVPIVPLKFKKSIGETIFAPNYLEEMIMGYIDNLNLLYVALTRAEEAMIIGLTGIEKNGIKRAGHLILETLARTDVQDGPLKMKLSDSLSDSGFSIGELKTVLKSEQIEYDRWTIGDYPVSFRNTDLKLRLKSSEYFLNSTIEGSDHLDFGNIMHEIFALIKTPGDVDKAVMKYFREGLLKADDAAIMKDLIKEKISGPEVAAWFEEGNEVLNERELFSSAKSYRPDRVILRNGKAIVTDYKFGDQELKKYTDQVETYRQLLQELGFSEVDGYIWYVMLDKIVKVS